MKPIYPQARRALLLSCLVLGACTVGPDFRRPETPQPLHYSRDSLNELDGAHGQQLVSGENPAADWWTLLGSDALDRTMQQALAGNRELAAADATLAQAREAVNAAAGTQLPQLSAQAGLGRQQYGVQSSGTNASPPFTYYSIGPSVSYLLDYTGSLRRAVEQQQALADDARYRRQAAYLSLTGNVAEQALAIAATRAQLATVEALIDDDRRNLALVQTAFDAGSATRVDLLSAQSQLAGDQTRLPSLRQQLSVAEHALAILVGHTPADWSPPDFELDGLSLPQQLPLSLPSELAHRRPDILAAEAQLHAATAGVGVATAKLYPQIQLSASFSQQSSELSQLFDASSTAWSLIGGLSAPLFDGGTLRAQRRGAEDARQAAAARYQQTVLSAFGQVADVLSALQHDAEQLDAQQRSAEIAESALKLARESYRYGNVGVLQVLDAERQYQQAELGLLGARAQRYQDSVALFLALGGDTLQKTVAGNP